MTWIAWIQNHIWEIIVVYYVAATVYKYIRKRIHKERDAMAKQRKELGIVDPL